MKLIFDPAFEANGGRSAGYFHSLNAALEVKARTRAVNDKITYAAEVQSVLRQLLHEVRILPCSASQEGDSHSPRHPALAWNSSLLRLSQSKLLS